MNNSQPFSDSKDLILEDNIYNLKQDEFPPKADELKVIGNLFGNSTTVKKPSHTMKIVLVATILFFILSLPFIDRLLQSTHSSCDKIGVRLFIKSLLFMIIFFIVYLQLVK